MATRHCRDGRRRAAMVAAVMLAVAAPARADDAAEGAALYEHECAPCHFAATLPLEGRASGAARLQPAMMATYGPKLIAILGRAAGSDPAFLYSASFRAASQGLVWTPDALDRFLTDSRAMLPGIRMLYRQPDPDIRRKIIAYLATTG